MLLLLPARHSCGPVPGAARLLLLLLLLLLRLLLPQSSLPLQPSPAAAAATAVLTAPPRAPPCFAPAAPPLAQHEHSTQGLWRPGQATTATDRWRHPADRARHSSTGSATTARHSERPRSVASAATATILLGATDLACYSSRLLLLLLLLLCSMRRQGHRRAVPLWVAQQLCGVGGGVGGRPEGSRRPRSVTRSVTRSVAPAPSPACHPRVTAAPAAPPPQRAATGPVTPYSAPLRRSVRPREEALQEWWRRGKGGVVHCKYGK